VKKTTIPDDLQRIGFETIDPSRKFLSLSVCSSGMEGSGKTRWACLAPEPVAIISFDPGTERVVKRLRKEGREIYGSFVEIPTPGTNKERNKQVYGPIWDKLETQLLGLADSKSMSGGTVVVDTATEMRELARLAILGALKQVGQFSYGDVNDRMRPLCKRIILRGDLNSVWIHKVGKVYVKGADGNSHWNGKFERRGFDDIRYLTDVIVEHEFDQRKGKGGVFKVKVVTNKEYMALSGETRVSEANMEGDEVGDPLDDPASFASIAMDTFPESEEGDWA
jgi:hypothetical protein